MEDELYDADGLLIKDEYHSSSDIYLNGGSDVPDGASMSSLGPDDIENSSSVNDSGSEKDGSVTSEDICVDGVAEFEDPGEEDNISADQCCAECGRRDGSFLACLSCGLFYHNKCLMQCFLPAGEDTWRCPQCQWKMINAGEAPLDSSFAHGDMSDGSHSGYDLPGSHSGAEDVTDEVFRKDKEEDIRGVRSSSPSPTRESASDMAERKRKKPVTEGSNFQTKINVGYGYQVPFTPAFFLDDSANDMEDKHEWARLVYSPVHLEKIRARRVRDGSLENVVNDEFEMAEYMQLCAQNWKNNPGWHPFSPEFAYKILHFADYDPRKALRVMNDPNFSFVNICDPPTRRYENKWKPKDRRGQVATSPYPPPVTLRGYLLRKHDASK